VSASETLSAYVSPRRAGEGLGERASGGVNSRRAMGGSASGVLSERHLTRRDGDELGERVSGGVDPAVSLAMGGRHRAALPWDNRAPSAGKG
jgi:hypothetical protein